MKLLNQTFKSAQVVKLTGISRSKLDRLIWLDMLNIKPQGSGFHLKYRFEDVFRIKLLMNLQDAGLQYKTCIKVQEGLTNRFIYSIFTYVIDLHRGVDADEPTSIDDICPKSTNDQKYRNMYQTSTIVQGISLNYNPHIIANDLLIKYFEEVECI